MRSKRALGGLAGLALVVLAACGGGGDGGDAGAQGGGTLGVAASVPGPTVAAAATVVTVAETAAATTTVPATTTTMPPTTPPPPPTTPPPPPPCTVVAVGDSVGQDVYSNGFGASLASVGCELLTVRGARGITMEQGAAALGGAADVPATVAVVILGYHNAVSQTRSGQFPAMIDDVMAAAGDRVVVWPMVGRTPDCGPSYSNAAVVASQMLQEATARWPNLVPVDYPSVINAHPEYSQNRCPHLVNSGSQAVGLWLAGEVRRAVDAA